MKKVLFVIGLILTQNIVNAQDVEWRERSEVKIFLAKMDSVLEKTFGHELTQFSDFEAGALNYIKIENNLPGGTEEYVYNEAYSYSMAKMPIPFSEMPESFFWEFAIDQVTEPATKSYMELLDPDKFWVSYHEFNGVYYFVLCLGVDREAYYRSMGWSK
jgi:hypothetical protein